MAEKLLRCAVYTRKSTEDGLEQEFNSLDAQYEACSAYALSQRHEGWVLVKERYDDGGFSGGNMERPGLKRLLADIEAGRIDIVLLYKIDRLTRSLTDFARIVDVMDARGASFVSITQSFNTTTSMGRLTLNMLLSFAQFEREVTGERIRDKIAASKKKGMWMGGPVPLGYEVVDRKLVVQEDEAEQVRHIMRRYLALGTVPLLVEELEREGYRTKVQRRTSGPHRGGSIYRRGTLYHLLSNRIYRGMIAHKGKAYAGEHSAVIDEALWNEVQAKLQDNACGSSRRKRQQNPSLLIGKVFDGEGRAMTPSHAQRGKKRYRYYVTRHEEVDSTPAWRVNAYDLEQLICEHVAARLDDKRFVAGLGDPGKSDAAAMQRSLELANEVARSITQAKQAERANTLAQIIDRVDLETDHIAVKLDRSGIAQAFGIQHLVLSDDSLTITIPAIRVRRGHQQRLIIPGKDDPSRQPARRDEKLIALVAEAFAARRLVEDRTGMSLAAIAAGQGKCRTRMGRMLRLSCLAPDIVTTIVEGRQPAALTVQSLSQIDLPLDWQAQRNALGLG